MTDTIKGLLDRIEEEARRADFPVDEAVYRAADKDPIRPIFCAGALDAPVCIVGRDLGRDEVRLGQPLVGAGGSQVRRGILTSFGRPDLAAGGKAELAAALEHALLTNTVPYKPPGNKAYSDAVKERFRPFLTELLTRFWTGVHILTLGTEAFRWFELYGDCETFGSIGQTDGRFEASFRCHLPLGGAGEQGLSTKLCHVLPLPHPSPLNRRWFAAFPGMFAARLAEARASEKA